MAHPVLTDTDISVAITLYHDDGTTTDTRGVVRFVSEADTLDASGWNAWTPTPANGSAVRRLTVTRPDGSGTDAYTSLRPGGDRESGAMFGAHDELDTTRWQLCPEGED